MKKVRYYRLDCRTVVGSLIFSVPLLVLGVFILFRWELGDTLFWIATPVFIVGGIGNYLWCRYRLNVFRCPNCGKELPETVVDGEKSAEPTGYSCDRCEIEWQMDCLCFPVEDDS